MFRRVDPVGNTLIEGGDKGRFVVSRYFSYPTGQPPETIPTPPPFPDFALGGTARAGVAMIEVKLTPVDDSKLENDELAKLKLLPGSAYVVDALKALALIRIVDKEENHKS